MRKRGNLGSPSQFKRRRQRLAGLVSCLSQLRGPLLHPALKEEMQRVVRLPRCDLWTCGMDGTWPRRPVDRSAGGRLHAERPQLVIGSPPSRMHSPWIEDEREARLQGIKRAVYRWQTELGVTLSSTNIHEEASSSGLGLHERQ